jgi:CheY-like chemotaxis protein
MAQARLNLKGIVALIVDRDAFTRGLISQMLRGFGVTSILTADNGSDAKTLLGAQCPDVCFVEGGLPDMGTDELIVWVRRNANKALRFVPMIVLSGYTQMRMISVARDAGAHLVVRKPLSPQILFDRIGWVAKFDRAFLETPNYVGPDRRFHAVDPPDGNLKRAADKDQAQPAALQA